MGRIPRSSLGARIRERVRWLLVPPAVRDELRALNEALSVMERDWRRLSSGVRDEELTPFERQDAIEASYQYWQRDPLMGRAIQLIRDYTFGRGVTWKAKDPRISKVLNKFWNDRTNRILAKAVGQWELSERLQLAGEVFLIFFVNPFTGRVKARVVEPQEITQVITDPDDREQRLYYERRWSRQEFNWSAKAYTGAVEQKIDYIPDWDNRNPQHATVNTVKTHVYMHFVKINSHGVRGVPLNYRTIPWVKAYKGFMEDRATITLASATYAFKQKIKGSAAAVGRAVQQWGSQMLSRYGGVAGRERAEGARTMVENESASLEQFNFDTRSSNAYLDGRMLRQQVAAGTGITEQNLTGDPSIANLASATQMEGPMLKMFESWQQLWKDEFSDILEFVVRMAEIYGPLKGAVDLDRTIEVNFPPIVVKDLPVIIGAVAQLISAQTMAGKEYVSHERLAAYVLEAFGETDIDTALKELKAQPAPALPDMAGALPDDQADKLQAALGAMIRFHHGEGDARSVAEAFKELAEVIQSASSQGNGRTPA